MKKIIPFILSFVLILTCSLSVSAENLEFVAYDSPYCVIDDSPTAISLFSTETMAYSRMTYYSLQDTPDGEFYETDFYTIGKRITSYYPVYADIFIINDDGLLFENPGTLSLLLFAHGNELIITTYFEGGGSKDYYIDPKLYDGTISVIIDNFDANIKSIRITLNLYNPGQYVTPTSVLSLDGYSYEIKEFTIFDLLVAFFDNFFQNAEMSFFDVLKDFFGQLSKVSFFREQNQTLENQTDDIFDSVGSIVSIQFYQDIFDNVALLNCFNFISSCLFYLFTKIQFSVIFYISCTLLLVAISLGFARHWRGGGK